MVSLKLGLDWLVTVNVVVVTGIVSVHPTCRWSSLCASAITLTVHASPDPKTPAGYQKCSDFILS
jgi:hypothetical protein